MKSNRRFVLVSIFVGLVVLPISIVGGYSAAGAPLDQILSPQTTITLSLDDGSAESAIGWDLAWEFVFLNRFTPGPSQFPLQITQIQVYFKSSFGVAIGDNIMLVVYEDADSNPANGATLLYSCPTTIQALDAWNVHNIAANPPLVVEGPGDILVGVIALEAPETGYFPAAIDQTTSEQRSWIGWWSTWPPDPSDFPPDENFEPIHTYDWAGNWMIRAYGATVNPNSGFVYLPVILYDYPPIPTTPVLYPINNPTGDKNYTVSWSTANRADSYVLEEDDNQAFNSPVTRYNGSFTSWSALGKPDGTYFYRVKAHNSWGDSGWSNVHSTTVVPPPPPQTTVYVINNLACSVCYEIIGTGIGQKCFTSETTTLYGTFPTGTYSWSASSTCCGSGGGKETFAAGTKSVTFTCVSQQPAATIRYASPGGFANGACDSWQNACELQNALSVAAEGEEVWVKQGVYKPTSTTDRTISFALKSGVEIYGGFAGTESAREERDWAANLTILSGDIDSNDSQTPIVTDAYNVTGVFNNSYHVVTSSAGATLDGFIITAGNANGEVLNGSFGGGMFNDSSSPSLTNIIFSGNLASSGGGIYNLTSDPVLADVTFTGNYAGNGGGIANNEHSSPTLTNVTFSSNRAGSAGGGMDNYHYSSATLINVTFSSNRADRGAGMNNDYFCDSTLTNVTFSGNQAVWDGGGMRNYDYSSPVLTNVTFSDNSAGRDGGGMANFNTSAAQLFNVTFSGNSAGRNGGGMYSYFSYQRIRNSIFWGNESPLVDAQIFNNGNYSSVKDSIVQDGCPGSGLCENVIAADPLLGVLGDYGGFTLTIPIQANSPAIDTANDAFCPATDQRGITRPKGEHCDIGAFEYVETIQPTIESITRLDPSPTNLASVSFMVTFSESVMGVDKNDFTLNASGVIGSSITSVSGGSTAYTVAVNTGTGSGALRLDVPSDAAITDLSQNPLAGLPYTSGDTYSVDKAAPTVAMTSLAADPTNVSPIPISVAFNESVTGFTSADILPTNGAVSNFTGTGASYTFDLTPAGQGLVKAEISAGVASDPAGNGNTIAAPLSRVFDSTAPAVVSSRRLNPNPTDLASVRFMVTFSEPVTSVEINDFSLELNGISGAVVSGVNGSGGVYTVTVSTGSGTGTIRLDVMDNDTIVDLALNPLGGAGTNNGNYTNGDTYQVRFHWIYLPAVVR